MTIDAGLLAWVEEALAPLGEVTMRRMMGGATLYLDGTIFAILHGGDLWFKADAETDARWDAAGCRRFTVQMRDGRTDSMNYRLAPSEVHDDPEAMRDWAELAIAAGRRRPVKRKRTATARGKAAASPPGIG